MIGNIAKNMFNPGFWAETARAAAPFNPIDLFNGSQRTKLMQYFKSKGAAGFASDYFGGKTMFGMGGLVGGTAESVARTRKLAAGGMLGLGAANMIAPDSFVTSAGNFGLGLSLHGTIANALFQSGRKGLGVGYGAWAGLNMLRSGDNFGPF